VAAAEEVIVPRLAWPFPVVALWVAGCGGAPSPGRTSVDAPAVVVDSGAQAASHAEAAEPVLTLDLAAGHPVRGRLRSHTMWTYVEACVQEVVAATTDTAARVRYTLRLCAEDGRTEAIALGWSKEEGRRTLFPDSIYETAVGGESHLYFSCPYGTAWEVDATADSLQGDRVRLSVRGRWLACTK
jgi:hypothetical protein